jgi:hypothetical protein
MDNSEVAPQSDKKKCLVVMGFGHKTDFQTGRMLDLDKTYRTIIKPAVEAAGLECIRADDLIHSGLIDKPMYELLLNAEVVVADLSTSHTNTLYQLGVRHALKPHTTIVICEDRGTPFAFDLAHVVIRPYHHLGDGIDLDEVVRFREVLQKAIEELLSKEPVPVDSPVYSFLPELNPPTIGEKIPPIPRESKPAAARAASVAPEAAAAPGPPELSPQTQAVLNQGLLNFVENLEADVKDRKFGEAKTLLAEALKFLIAEQVSGIANSPDMILRLVNAGCKVEGPNRHEALTTARRIFEFLSPTRSNNPETLQLLGDIELAIFEEKKDVSRLRRARQVYERLYTLRSDYRSGITLAYLVTLHAEHRKDVVEKLTDLSFANRLRGEVVKSCNEKLVRIDERVRTETRLMSEKGQHWTPDLAEASQEKLEVWAALAEAYYGLGDVENYQSALDVDEALLIQGDNSPIRAAEARIKLLAPILEHQSAFFSEIKASIGDGPDAGPVIIPSPARPVPYDVRAAAPESNTGGVPKESTRERDLIFFSYSHNERDREILAAIKKALGPIFQGQTIEMWDDSHIEPGQEWEKEIETALARAKGAVLIVSQDFLNSTFIYNEELPVILKGVEEEGVKLMWIAAEETFVKKTKIPKYQALHNPDETLDSFSGKKFKDKIFEICEKIDGLIFPDSN